MSSSTLYVMNEKFEGLVDRDFRNSWLFSPVVWDVLLDKYLHDEIQTPYGYTKSLIGPGGEGLFRKLNEKVNASSHFFDRMCWELSNQQVFFSKDREAVAQGILDFLERNQAFARRKEEPFPPERGREDLIRFSEAKKEKEQHERGVPLLAKEHIANRFREIAQAIQEIDPAQFPYFIWKNTSVDDNVDGWFQYYDETADDTFECTLRDVNQKVTEFVYINGNHIEFVDNETFFDALAKLEEQ